MGNPLSPMIANLYMEHFEEEALSTASVKPHTWLKYVDDTFVILNEEEEALENFHQHLNNQRPSIKYMREMEEPSWMSS